MDKDENHGGECYEKREEQKRKEKESYDVKSTKKEVHLGKGELNKDIDAAGLEDKGERVVQTSLVPKVLRAIL